MGFWFRAGADGAFVGWPQSPRTRRFAVRLLAGSDLANGPGFDDYRIDIAIVERHSTTHAADGQPLFVWTATRPRASALPSARATVHVLAGDRPDADRASEVPSPEVVPPVVEIHSDGRSEMNGYIASAASSSSADV